MTVRVLTLKELNRATLTRQLLLDRAAISVPEVLERLVGMQAQLASAPYVGLWTRLKDFKREDLAAQINNHSVVKVTLQRATLHLVTAVDYQRLRATLHPVMAKASASIRDSRDSQFDVEKVLNAARAFIAQQPRSFAEISTMLTDLMPDVDVGAMRYTVRTHLHLIQVPVAQGWGFPGNPKFTLADLWLDHPTFAEEDFPALVRRYLAAFGPASATDLQTWSGLEKLSGPLGKLKNELTVYKDEQGRELYDVPGTALPDADIPVPERFLPEFDNVLLSHSKRTRIIADEFRPKVYLPGLRVAATILVDGYVRGAWKVETEKKDAILVIEPFAPLTKANRAALLEEGERLVRFVAPDAKSHGVRFND